MGFEKFQKWSVSATYSHRHTALLSGALQHRGGCRKWCFLQSGGMKSGYGHLWLFSLLLSWEGGVDWIVSGEGIGISGQGNPAGEKTLHWRMLEDCTVSPTARGNKMVQKSAYSLQVNFCHALACFSSPVHLYISCLKCLK